MGIYIRTLNFLICVLEVKGMIQGLRHLVIFQRSMGWEVRCDSLFLIDRPTCEVMGVLARDIHNDILFTRARCY